LVEISADDARRVALWSQGFLGGEPTPAVSAKASEQRQTQHVGAMLEHLGAVQLDTISVLARTHELVAYARLGAIRRSAIEQAYWSGDRAFEYWSHAACILPMDAWPNFAFRRRHYRDRGMRWHDVTQKDIRAVRRLVLEEGPITTAHVGGAKNGGPWWDWSGAKIALEYLLDMGEVVVTKRVGWRRTYDLAERVVPDSLFHDDRSDDECVTELVAAGARSVGIGTAGDIADVHRLPKASVARHADAAGLVPVSVKDWPRAWATHKALEWLSASGRDRHRTTLLSPFDSLIWFRERTERVFGMHHRLEAYTPAPRRIHGYFAMPVLHRGELVARVDPKRDGSTLVAQTVTFESTAPEAIRGTAVALREAASWVCSDAVRLVKVVPSSAAKSLAGALRAAGL
jgi:uncharacterized protein